MITFSFLRVQKPKCLTISRLSAASGPPRSGPVINKTVTSYQNCSQLFFVKTKASALYKKDTFVIRFNSTGVQKPKFPVMSRLSTASCPPRSGIVKNKTVTSYHKFQSIVFDQNQSFSSM